MSAFGEDMIRHDESGDDGEAKASPPDSGFAR